MWVFNSISIKSTWTADYSWLIPVLFYDPAPRAKNRDLGEDGHKSNPSTVNCVLALPQVTYRRLQRISYTVNVLIYSAALNQGTVYLGAQCILIGRVVLVLCQEAPRGVLVISSGFASLHRHQPSLRETLLPFIFAWSWICFSLENLNLGQELLNAVNNVEGTGALVLHIYFYFSIYF